MNDIQRDMQEILKVTKKCVATVKMLRESLKSPNIDVDAAMKKVDELEPELKRVRSISETNILRDSIPDGSPDDSTSLGL